MRIVRGVALDDLGAYDELVGEALPLHQELMQPHLMKDIMLVRAALEVDVMRKTSSIARSASSMGRVTKYSTSWEGAPG